MSQSKIESLIESLLNIFVGYGVALIAQIVIFPLFNIYVSHYKHAAIGGLFTIVSLVRSYTIRRLFNNGIYNKLKEVFKK